MSEEFIDSVQWSVKTLLQHIKNGDIRKPKFQRKKKWHIMPQKGRSPNERQYIIFLCKKRHGFDAIKFSKDKIGKYVIAKVLCALIRIRGKVK